MVLADSLVPTWHQGVTIRLIWTVIGAVLSMDIIILTLNWKCHNFVEITLTSFTESWRFDNFLHNQWCDENFLKITFPF